MAPQLTAGGGIPKPRKLKLASVRIIAGILVVNCTIIGAMILGIIWSKIILMVGEPAETAAWIYIFCLIVMVALLINLEPVMPHVIPSTRINCITPGPVSEMRWPIINIKPGKHITASTNRCTIRSNVPPM